MTSLSKKALVVSLMGLGAFCVTSLIPRWSGEERQQSALARLDLECRAYRSAPPHQNAEVCREYDSYAPHEVRLQLGINRKLDDARAAAARGDDRATEVALRSVLEELPRLDGLGTFLAALVGAGAISRTLAFLDAHPSLDRAFVLRDVHFELLHHPLEGYGLQRRWQIAHQEKLGQSETADGMNAAEKSALEMERAAFRFDEAGCNAATEKGERVICPRLVTLAHTSARLDAMRR